jgi:hypothetical protein
MQFNCGPSDIIINTKLNFMARTKPHKNRTDQTAATYLINKSLISQSLKNTNDLPIDVVNVEKAGVTKTPAKSSLCDFILANNNDVYICGSNGCNLQDISLSGSPIIEYYSDSNDEI